MGDICPGIACHHRRNAAGPHSEDEHVLTFVSASVSVSVSVFVSEPVSLRPIERNIPCHPRVEGSHNFLFSRICESLDSNASSGG